jgi:hypothetical protein
VQSAVFPLIIQEHCKYALHFSLPAFYVVIQSSNRYLLAIISLYLSRIQFRICCQGGRQNRQFPEARSQGKRALIPFGNIPIPPNQRLQNKQSFPYTWCCLHQERTVQRPSTVGGGLLRAKMAWWLTTALFLLSLRSLVSSATTAARKGCPKKRVGVGVGIFKGKGTKPSQFRKDWKQAERRDEDYAAYL